MVRLRSVRRLAPLVWVAVPLACQEPFVGPPHFSPVLSARELWGGGELRLSDAAFATTLATPIVQLAGEPLHVRRIDDTTMSVQLPRRAGSFPLRLVAGQVALPLGDVTLHGFRSAEQSAFMSGQPYWLPAGAPLVFAGADPGAAVFDLRTGLATMSFPDSMYSSDCANSVGPTDHTWWFVLAGRAADGTCSRPKLWAIASQPQLMDILPTGRAWIRSWYASGQPTDGRWIFNQNNFNLFVTCETGSCTETRFLTGDGPDGVTISPRGDRFLWLPAVRAGVYDARTLDTAFVLRQFRDVHAAFSFEGDTLAFTAVDSMPPHRAHLVAIRSSDGTILRDLVLDSLAGPGGRVRTSVVAFDPVRPWLYALIWIARDASNIPTLLVLDRESWSVIGVLEARSGTPFIPVARTIVPSPLEHLVYVVAAHHGYNIHRMPGLILRFSTP